MSWTAIRVFPGTNREAVVAALFAQGSQGIQETDDAVLTHFPPESNFAQLTAAISSADSGATIESWPVENVDWTRKWREGIRAHKVGSLTIAPPWFADDLDPATSVIIEPGMAFGTGEHPTTRGVLRLMDGIIRPGDVVADLGAGSAALAIAAAKLGARHAIAIEMDTEAISNAEENVVANGVSDRVTVFEGEAEIFLPIVAPVRVILANIISSVLAELLPTIRDSLTDGGVAILSGILGEERERMIGLLTASGWTIDAEDAEDIWWSVRIRR